VNVDAALLRVPWGATEGGRDTLEWVRQIVRHTEKHPLYSAALPGLQGGGSGRGLASLEERLGNPSEHVSGRQCVHLLADWLSSALAALPQSSATASTAVEAASVVATPPPYDGVALGAAAMAVYGAAFDELRGALAIESRDRAELLHALWSHFFSLVQLRSDLTYEAALCEARAAAAALDEAREAAVQAGQRKEHELAALRAEHAKELALKDAQTKNIAQV
jgi:hypothetical protein